MKRFTFILFALLTFIGANAQSIYYGNYTGNETLANWGTSKAENYSVAMKIDNPGLVGMKVTGLRIPVNPAAVDVADFSAFLTKELAAANGIASGDIANVEFTPDGEWTIVALPEPYEITSDAFYCGYTFKVTKFDALTGDGAPLRVMVGAVKEGLMIVSSKSYRRWTDVSSTYGGSLAMQLVIEAQGAAESVSIGEIESKRVNVNEGTSFNVQLVNYGTENVNNVTYSYSVADQTVSNTTNVFIDASTYGATATISIDVPAIATIAEHKGELTITQVNGKANASKEAVGTNIIKVMSQVPVKRALMEEFTGAWCGFCPSGFIGMKLMNERHSEDFICASYHNKDAMQITQNYPVPVNSFPAACLDRSHMTDAYLGDTNRDMGIESTWKSQCELPTPLDINVKADLTSNTGIINVESECTFRDNAATDKYGIAYIITADGLCGTGKNWCQENYYSPDVNNGTYTNMYKVGMEQFNTGGEYIYLKYDDVVIAQSGESGETIDGVFGATCNDGDIVKHEFSFDTADMNANYTPVSNLVQDKNRLHAIALVYDKATMQVLNCAKCNVSVDGVFAGITEHMQTGNRAQQNGFYNILGQKVSGSNTNGILIQKNGSAKKYLQVKQ